jgi:hypothetical protein
VSREYVLYTDESVKEGRYFANFYGGALIRSHDLERVNSHLWDAATAQGLTAEVKWQKVSLGYLNKYVALMDAFFDLVSEDRIKVRIMFTQTLFVPRGITKEKRENEYQILYYQFLKHAFGLQYSNAGDTAVRLRILMDQLPDTAEKNAQFKGYIAARQHSPQFKEARILISQDQISEVRSHDHIVLQCLDVVLGAMQFRLNDHHLAKPDGAAKRGARTIAKEKLYRHINTRIRALHPNFNVGTSTGNGGDLSTRWTHRYRHWRFMPSERDVDHTRAKGKK